MPYAISFEMPDMIVTVRVSGEASHDEHYAARDEAMRVCQEKHCSKLLVDLRELNTAHSSIIDCFSFGESLAQIAISLSIAHVLPKDAKSKADVRFTSTVEANRGITSREFETIDEARKWLLEKA